MITKPRLFLFSSSVRNKSRSAGLASAKSGRFSGEVQILLPM
ncbi:hypothetical protein D1AOALGA4SA_1170 [Olavius algarvensis Delta 1 endosymbiont]|nr:hypothetical protein D1AOALGA4SA_1170 [Olavius algarvensis Delta 1 endosymbiont]